MTGGEASEEGDKHALVYVPELKILNYPGHLFFFFLLKHFKL